MGARPQFVKLAPIAWTSKDFVSHGIIHTGQHYEPLLSDSFFETLHIPKPDFNLGVGSGSHAEQTGKMLVGIEEILQSHRPDHVILYGDTNSTLSGAIVASKLDIPISHIEAGLRSFNRRMPEEINRILTDHCSNLLFAPTKTAMKNLHNEGLGSSSFLSGDVMIETIEHIVREIDSDIPEEDFIFCTIHRAENTDNADRIKDIIFKLRKSLVPVHLYCHPRLRNILTKLGLFYESQNLKLFSPLNYMDSIKKISASLGVITDSGGIQKESYILSKSCMIVRNETEWVELLSNGAHFLDSDLISITSDWWSRVKVKDEESLFGKGQISKFILEKILNFHS